MASLAATSTVPERPPPLPTFERYRDELWERERVGDANLRAGIGPGGDPMIVNGVPYRYDGPPLVPTPETWVHDAWVQMIQTRVHYACAWMCREVPKLEVTGRPYLAAVLGAVDARVPTVLDVEAARKLAESSPGQTVRQKLHEAMELIGIEDGTIIPNEVRWGLLDRFGLREPLPPPWAKPGAYVFDPWRGCRGCNVRIERVEPGRGVLLAACRELVPMGLFVRIYEGPSHPEENGLPCVPEEAPIPRSKPWITRQDLGVYLNGERVGTASAAPIGTALHDAKKGETVEVLLTGPKHWDGGGSSDPIKDLKSILESASLQSANIVLPPDVKLELLPPAPSPELAALRAFGKALHHALTDKPPRELLRAYVDRNVTEPAEHAAIASALESGDWPLRVVFAQLDGLRRTADCLRRGFSKGRAREEGLAQFVETFGPCGQRVLPERWDALCDVYDRARGLR